MARSPDAVLAELLSLPAQGWALPREADSNWGRLLTPLAAELARVEDRAEALQSEVDPRIAGELLPDFERVLGDDPCLGSVVALPIDIRRRLAHQRWTAQGGATLAFFIGLAASIGVTITIEESKPSYAGVFECGTELCPESEVFSWRVTLPANALADFYSGEGQAGDPLGGFDSVDPSPVECLIRRHAPAHTIVVFDYSGA